MYIPVALLRQFPLLPLDTSEVGNSRKELALVTAHAHLIRFAALRPLVFVNEPRLLQHLTLPQPFHSKDGAGTNRSSGMLPLIRQLRVAHKIVDVLLCARQLEFTTHHRYECRRDTGALHSVGNNCARGVR